MGKHVKAWHVRMGEAFPPRVRVALYGIACGMTALLGVYGILNDEQIFAWNFLGAALFVLAAERVPVADDWGRRED